LKDCDLLFLGRSCMIHHMDDRSPVETSVLVDHAVIREAVIAIIERQSPQVDQVNDTLK
jgi:hypothetical protein